METEAKKPYLTKSLFKLASECPRKLFYQTHPHQYENQSKEDPFIEGLANGGYQVEGLSRELFPNGIEIEAESILDIDAQTRKYLSENDKCVLFQAGIIVEDMAAVFDILNVYDDTIELIEVKAKSIDEGEVFFKNNNKGIKKEWLPYLLDVSFQVCLLEKAFPDRKIISKLALIDKSKKCKVDGMNQRFVLKPKENSYKTEVIRKDGPVDTDLIKIISVKEEIEFLKQHGISNEINQENKNQLHKSIKVFSKSLASEQKLHPKLGTHCKKCEFNSDNISKSGVHECWKNQENKPLTFEVWNPNQAVKKWIESGKHFMHELKEEDIFDKDDPEKEGLSKRERQWLQVERTLKSESKPYFDHEAFKNQLHTFTYPFHFIDFEASRVALPFFKDTKPYQIVIFQYSHHIMHEDGKLAHKSEYIDIESGSYPNFEFVRNLKSSLENDEGSIFQFHHYENDVLGELYVQLRQSSEPDQDELCAWIESITQRNEKKSREWSWPAGDRHLVDLRKMVLDYYYHPLMKGSNSIKHVFPAIIEDSKFVQDKYSKPIYGTQNIPSKNFENKVWISKDEQNKTINPYSQLPKLSIGQREFDASSEDLPEFQHESIGNGGAAMMAYAYLQFSEVPNEVRESIKKSLLQYCELDTLAMAMIMEAWINYKI